MRFPVLEQRVGHGDLGIRGPVRLFADVVSRAAYEKRVLLDASPSVTVTNWSADQGGAFSTAFDQRFDGVVLDVDSVSADGFPPLERVESLADVRSKAGTFFYDIVDVPSIARWDDGTTLWDSAARWDQFSILYVHLPDNTNPNTTIVVANIAFRFANRGIVEPSLGDEKLSNGDFESGFSGWTESGGGAFIQLTGNAIEGTTSVVWILASPGTNSRDLTTTFTASAGLFYRVSLVYEADGDATLQIIVTGPSGEFIQANGREPGPAEDPSIIVSDTNGLRRRAVFDFRAWEDGLYTVTLRASAVPNPNPVATWDDAITTWDSSVLWDDFGTGAPTVLVDLVSVRPLWRFHYHEPRVAANALPSVQTGSRDVFFAAQQIGSGNISLVGADGFFDSALELFDWEQAVMSVRVGGAVTGEGREELLADDYRTQFTGIIRNDSWSNDGVDFSLEDVRGFVNQSIPFRIYDPVTFPDMDTKLDGKSRPIWFGTQTNLTPLRIGITGLDYGIYELADPTTLVNGIVSIDSVFAYVDSDAASALDAARRVLLTEGSDYSVDLTMASITVLQDVQVIEITLSNNFLDWDEGGGALVAQIATGVYTPAGLASAITTALNSVGGVGKAASYDQTTNLFTLSIAAGALSLLTQTGANRSNAVWSEIGFDTDADKTGSLSYVGDSPIFVAGEADSKHILRVDGVGARDTVPVPTYTATSGDPIELGADVTRFIWEQFLQQSLELIDEPSFTAGRSQAPQKLGIYISETTDIRSVFQKIQNSNRSNIVIDGDGGIRFIVNQPGIIPSGTPVLDDADFVRLRIRKDIGDVHGVVRVTYAKDPTLGSVLVRTATDPETAVKFNRTGAREFETFLLSSSDAETVASSFLALAAKPPRKAELTVKGLVDKVEGEKLVLNRARGVETSGALSGDLFRILLVRKQPDSAETEIVAVEDI